MLQVISQLLRHYINGVRFNQETLQELVLLRGLLELTAAILVAMVGKYPFPQTQVLLLLSYGVLQKLFQAPAQLPQLP